MKFLYFIILFSLFSACENKNIAPKKSKHKSRTQLENKEKPTTSLPKIKEKKKNAEEKKSIKSAKTATDADVEFFVLECLVEFSKEQCLCSSHEMKTNLTLDFIKKLKNAPKNFEETKKYYSMDEVDYYMKFLINTGKKCGIDP